MHNIPKYGMPIHELNTSLSQVKWSQCKFFSYEWPTTQMTRCLKPVLGSYHVLTSFREPLSHFFSACFHNSVRDKSRQYNIRHAVNAVMEGNTPHEHYNLYNFQTSFLVNRSLSADMLKATGSHAVISMARDYVKQVYWFSLSEHIALSLSLLQCQVFGTVLPVYLDAATKLPTLNNHFSSNDMLRINSKLLSDIHSLIRLDIYLYEIIVREFWERIEQHKQCLMGMNSRYDWNLFET